MQPTRASLLLRVKDPRDDRAWEEFRDTYHPLIQRYVASRSRALGLRWGEHEVEEAAVDVFSKLWRRLPAFDLDHGIGRFRTYLWRTVANGIVDRTRHKTRGGGPPLDESQARLEEVSGGTDADGELRRALSGALLVSVMRRVRDQVVARNPPQWESFERHWLGGRPAAAVAEDLGISVDLVYQNASRILKALRRELSVEGAEELLP